MAKVWVVLHFYERSYNLNFIRICLEKIFFEGCSWFKFHNLELAIDMALKSYTSVAKWLKLKFKKFFGLIPTFVGITWEKLVGGAFTPILYRIKTS